MAADHHLPRPCTAHNSRQGSSTPCRRQHRMLEACLGTGSPYPSPCSTRPSWAQTRRGTCTLGDLQSQDRTIPASSDREVLGIPTSCQEQHRLRLRLKPVRLKMVTADTNDAQCIKCTTLKLSKVAGSAVNGSPCHSLHKVRLCRMQLRRSIKRAGPDCHSPRSPGSRRPLCQVPVHRSLRPPVLRLEL